MQMYNHIFVFIISVFVIWLQFDISWNSVNFVQSLIVTEISILNLIVKASYYAFFYIWFVGSSWFQTHNFSLNHVLEDNHEFG